MKKRNFILVGIFCLTLLVVLFAIRGIRDSDRSQNAIPLTGEGARQLTTEKQHTAVNILGSKKDKSAVEKTTESIEQRAQRIRSDIKISLAAIYTGQKSFFSEYKRYTTDLVAAGYGPSDDEINVKAGFLEPYFPKEMAQDEDPRNLDTEVYVNRRNEAGDNTVHFGESAQDISLRSLRKYCESGCTASSKGFELLSVANLDDDPTLDVWRISNDKTIVHLVDDLKE